MNPDKSNNPKTNSSENSRGKAPNRYMKYSGMGFQLIGSIILGYWLGTKLDAWSGNKAPLYTIGLAIFFTIGSLVLIIRDLMKDN